MRSTLLALSLLLPLCGCGRHAATLYQWGSYEPLLYTGFERYEPPVRQLAVMERESEQCAQSGRRLPPGWHAQMGYLYYQNGAREAARVAFMREKELYPESARFMDRLLKALEPR